MPVPAPFINPITPFVIVKPSIDCINGDTFALFSRQADFRCGKRWRRWKLREALDKRGCQTDIFHLQCKQTISKRKADSVVFYPLALKPCNKDYLWGGTRLKTDFGFVSDGEKAAAFPYFPPSDKEDRKPAGKRRV